MVLETDPLLPKGASAPEITGYGFTRPSKIHYQTQSEAVSPIDNQEDKDQEWEYASPTSFSPLRTLISLFAIVVGLAVFITLLAPGVFDMPKGSRPKDDPATLDARVNKILSEIPLIGIQYLSGTSFKYLIVP